MTFSSIIGFFKDLTVSIGVDYVKKYSEVIYVYVIGKLNSKTAYKRQLLNDLQSMPFIYRNIDSDIFNDYVVVEGTSIDIKTMAESSAMSLTSIVHKKRVIFFGNAGIGKTTFFRHSALSVLKRKNEEHMIDAQELLPIFIQLKAVSNFDKSPIVNYILKEITYFKSKNGIDRLLQLAQRQKLFILLDGYDEIGFVESANYISHELSAFMRGSRGWDSDNSYLDQEYLPFYKAVSSCKIWLSTRKEFFTLNPLKIYSENRGYDPQRGIDLDHYFFSLVLKGLGKNKLRLVKIIFDKYKAKSQVFKENLDEEKFYNDLLITNDDKLIEMSNNPLFLTIMCYLYVDKIEKSESVESKWLTNSYELINDCIRTLLTDLDKFKVREIEGVRKITFEQRRSSFYEEKRDFLRFFALKLYNDGKNVVQREYLKECALHYFTLISKSTNRATIVKQMSESSELANSDIVKQILYSGIFILIPGSTPTYDFPHRRFKETLALEALNDNEGLDLDLINKNLGEFILILFQNKPGRRREIVLQILTRLENNDSDYVYLNQLLYNCVTLTDEFDASWLIESQIFSFVERDVRILLSKDIVGLLGFDPRMVNEFRRLLDTQSLNYNGHNLLWGILISKYTDIAEPFFQSNYVNPDGTNIIIRGIYRLAFEKHNPNSLVRAFCNFIDGGNFEEAISVLLFDRLDPSLYLSFRNLVVSSHGWKYKFPALYIIYLLKNEEFELLLGERSLKYNSKVSYNFKYFKYLVSSGDEHVDILSSKIHGSLTDEISEVKKSLDDLLARKKALGADNSKFVDSELQKNIKVTQDKLAKLQEVLVEAREFKVDEHEKYFRAFDIIRKDILQVISSGVYF